MLTNAHNQGGLNVEPEICMTVGSSSYMTGLFLVSIRAARAMVQDDYFTVAEVLPGKAMLFVGSGEFRSSDIGPYREMYVGFYTENRERGKGSGLLYNVMELMKNESKMFMWKNWLSSQVAMDRMDRAGAEIFRRGELERTDRGNHVTLAMKHDTEGSIQFTVPKESRHAKDNFSLHKTHYGRLHGMPSKCQLDLNIKHMSTSPMAGELSMQGKVADECRALGIPKRPIASVWIEEMNFQMHKPVTLDAVRMGTKPR